ncbi:MAG: lipopolysaccharide biosynthesis protein [Desulfobacterales bacterium CG07_land_8_20_14_0_80_52_14]|nr:MAG: lipopolysaccharide biosynthesis protein [Desulfobacterales bacterium CG07_land_8_20_14_0_80_52_14]
MDQQDSKKNKAMNNNVPILLENRLPSTEVRSPVAEWDEEVHLRDYLEVMIRRKWLILSVLGLVFLSTLIFTLAATRIYMATGSIEVSKESAKVTKFEEMVSAEAQAREFYETQVHLLKSDVMAKRIIDKLNLENHPVIMGPSKEGEKTSFWASLKKAIKNLAVSEEDRQDPRATIGEEVLKQKRLMEFMKENFSVTPTRNAMLISISFTSEDRKLSQDVINTYLNEFINWKMDQRVTAAETAKGFLMQQIERAKISLEKAEEALNRFAQEQGIVSLDSKLNSIFRQLEELNTALALAESEFIQKEATYQQAVKDGPSSLAQVLSNEGITHLKNEYAKLYAKYEEMSTTFHDAYPPVNALKSNMASISEQIKTEENKIFQSIASDYKTALKKLEALKERVELQKKLAMELNERATQYKIMEREVETNKQIYNSLLERSKEIESMVGVSASNIHIVDRADLPVLPFKPKVTLNLLLAIVVGLMGGIGCAFMVEYFTDTITNPDEISDRFQIPILGVVPLAKTLVEGSVKSTLTANPRAPISEALRTIKVSIQLSGTENRAKSFLVSSTSPGEGKTTIAVNLALSFAGSGEQVLLVDTDLRKPRIHTVFSNGSSAPKHGLSSLLVGIAKTGIIRKSEYENLHYVPAGPIPPNPVELLASRRFAEFMKVVKKHYDRVILDGPPHQGFADVLVLCQNVGGIVLVSSIGSTTRQALRHFKKGILNVNGWILGCVINKVNLEKRYGYSSYYQYYQAYHYDYGDGKRKKRKILPW